MLVRVEMLNAKALFFIDWPLTVSLMMCLALLSTLVGLTLHLASICAPADCWTALFGFQTFSLFAESFAVPSAQFYTF